MSLKQDYIVPCKTRAQSSHLPNTVLFLTAFDDAAEAQITRDADAVYDEHHVIDLRRLAHSYVLIYVRHAATHHTRPHLIALMTQHIIINDIRSR